jgi:quercetin dioxygenase-like cupin family protein
MKIFSFNRDAGKPIEQLGSSAAMISTVARLNEPATVHCIHMEAEGLVGSHPAENPQIFMVVQGEGYFRGEGALRTPIQAGQAIYWDKGEWHETSTDTGMMAVVIESTALDPGEFMPEI